MPYLQRTHILQLVLQFFHDATDLLFVVVRHLVLSAELVDYFSVFVELFGELS